MNESPPSGRPAHFRMMIQGGMLDALGINMYTSIGKCLVEFVANAYDSDATRVDITVPFEEIVKARNEVRAAAKKEVADGQRDKFTVLTVPLPEGIEVTIKDDGHGMTPQQVQQRFVQINRNRRLDAATGKQTVITSESGRRHVMGRKGLGKMAGFGAADTIAVRTKREGETFATTFYMDHETLGSADNIQGVPLPAEYEDGLPPDEHGTTVTLRGLKCDAVKYGADSIKRTLLEAFFGVDTGDFAMRVNGALLEEPVVAYEYLYPEDRPHNGFARTTVEAGEAGEVTFDYVVKFRARQGDTSDLEGERGHLSAKKRGARIYCNNRLAAGPTLLDLPTGMHNFHSQSYMECVVHADELDRHEVDLINTGRTQLMEDNEVVEAFADAVTNIMKDALAAHGRFRDGRADEDIEKAKQGRMINKMVEGLAAKQRKTARQLLRGLVVQHGADSEEFEETAPIILQSMNASEVLVKLIELETDPGDITRVAEQLIELASIERRDVLKVYRGRRRGISALRGLIDRGYETPASGAKFEDELHDLLKECPWLIRPEYSRYVTSDENINKLVSVLARDLSIDKFAPLTKDGKQDQTRPDLAFVMADTESPNAVEIVELKSPNVPLEMEHLAQVKRYMRKVDEFLKQHISDRVIPVQGYLIGQMPKPETKAEGCRDLIAEVAGRGPGTEWEVIDLEQLLERSRLVHMEALEALEAEDAEEAAEAAAE